MTEPTTLTDADLPALFRAADKASQHGQHRYLRPTALRLALLVLAPAASTLSLHLGHGGLDAMAAVTAGAFMAAAFTELYLLMLHPERSWHDGRAVAESAKTLAWRYAIGAAPFGKQNSHSEEHAAQRLREQLAGLLRDAPDTSFEATLEPAIGDRLSELRHAPFQVRKDAYITGRIVEQQRWYTTKAKTNSRRSHAWRIALIVGELLAVAAATLRALETYSMDLSCVFAATIAAAAGWLSVKQHDALASAYTLAANELAIIRVRLTDIHEEHTWAAETADAEEAISREHTMWRATRSATSHLVM